MARRVVTPEGSSILRDGADSRWARTEVGDPDVHRKLASYAKALLQNMSSFHSKNRARERIYEGQELINNRAAVATLESAGIGIARLNATKSIVDTFTSRLSKDRPMPAFVVDDFSFDLKTQAKKYRQFVVGKMNETEFDDLSREGLLDGGILGNAFTRIDNDDNDVFAETMPVNEMLFDQRECRYGKPRQGIRVYRMAKDHLAELFPEAKQQIYRAPASSRRGDETSGDLIAVGNLDDYTDVYEGWSLPSTPDSEDGRRGLCIETVTLAFERWYEPRFPWAMLRLFKPRPGQGLWGTGFVDQLASLQHRVNCIVRDLQLNLAATGRGFFAVNENNDIPVEMLTGWQPFKLKFKGNQPPTFQAPTPFNQAQLNALEYFINKMYDLTGVSQANATSKSALGPGASGVALDTQYDIDSDRFRMPQANYARYRLEAAQRYIDAAARVQRRRAENKGRKRSFVAVTWKSRDAIERLEYDDVALKEGQYKLRIEAVNFLPDTRAGKLAVVEQLARAGVIPQWIVPTLFEEPDVSQANNIILAAFHNCMRKMDELVDVNKPAPRPEIYNDLDLELKISTAFYNWVQSERASLEIQDRYRVYVDQVTEEIKKKNTTALPPGSVGPGAEPMAPAEGPLPGGMPVMPAGPVPAPQMIGAPVPQI